MKHKKYYVLIIHDLISLEYRIFAKNTLYMSEVLVHLENALISQRNKPVLTDVNLQIKSGEFCYLIGSTGSGKSSLLKVLYGDLPFTHGRGVVVDFNLKFIKKKQIPYLRRKLGVVFQDFQLLTDRSVFDNLKFVLKATGWRDNEKIKKQIEKVLLQVNLPDKVNDFPHQLSGGEQQRVAIARALLNDPELILADEPTGNLDPKTSNEIMQVLTEINQKGQTVVMATHDYTLIYQHPFTTYQCEGGKLIEVALKS